MLRNTQAFLRDWLTGLDRLVSEMAFCSAVLPQYVQGRVYSKYLEKYSVVYSALRLYLVLSVELVREYPVVLGNAELVRLFLQYSRWSRYLEESLWVLQDKSVLPP